MHPVRALAHRFLAILCWLNCLWCVGLQRAERRELSVERVGDVSIFSACGPGCAFAVIHINREGKEGQEQ